MKIAMIDDNPTVMLVNEMMLKKEGVVTAEDSIDKFPNAEAFLDAFSKFPDAYGAVITDHHLGEGKMSGKALLENIQKSGYGKIMVLLTGTESMVLAMQMKFNKKITFIAKNNLKGEASTGALLAAAIKKGILV